MAIPIHPRMLQLSKLVANSQKLASVIMSKETPTVACTKALSEKIASDAAVMNFVKTAGGEVGGLLEKVLGGLALGAGVGVPLAVGGSMIADRMADRAEAASERNWDRITNAALGAAGIGAGLYALNRLTEPEEKTSADNETVLSDLMQKVATTALIDTLLTDISVGEEATKLATEMRILNNGYLTTLLAQLG